MNGIGLCRENGIKIGMRFTITMDNAHELPELLALMEREDVDKFYLSHLNYAGRGNRNRKDDAYHQVSRHAMDLLFDTCWHDVQAGRHREFVTGNNDADGVYLLFWVARHYPEHLDYMRARLEQWGGNSSGVNIANIDNLGNVHPDTFWWDYNLGNVRERPFSDIWQDTRDPLMAGLKATARAAQGALRRMRVPVGVRGQHTGQRLAADRRPVAGGSGLLPHRRGDRRQRHGRAVADVPLLAPQCPGEV
jgi:Fe-coproporphyrin III synthase